MQISDANANGKRMQKKRKTKPLKCFENDIPNFIIINHESVIFCRLCKHVPIVPQVYRRIYSKTSLNGSASSSNESNDDVKVVKNNTNKQINKFNLFTKNDGKKRSFSKNIPSNAEVIERDRIQI